VRSNARIQPDIVDGCTSHVQCQHIVDVLDRKASHVSALPGAEDGVFGTERTGVAGIEVAVDGRDGEVNLPVSVLPAPLVRRHAAD